MTGSGRTLVARVAHQLAELSLDAEAGSYIGGEDELLERLRVSRPTLRQAAKIAENERMISVRRGVRGGFYATRPEVSDAMRTITRYLRLQGAGLEHVQVIESLQLDAAGLAAGCTDPEMRARLVEITAAAGACTDAIGMMRADIAFAEHVAAMSGNPVVQLMVNLIYAFGREAVSIDIYSDQAERDEMQHHFNAVCAAIMAGDAELARFETNRRIKAVRGMIQQARSNRLDNAGKPSHLHNSH